MATGYDNRQPTRQSFAFKPQAAVQIDPRSQASSVNVGTRSGGANTGGGKVIRSENPVLGGNAGATLPAFLDQVFEPYVQEQQRKRMIEGATAYMKQQTMDQISKERPWLSNIFGPTDYHSGAATSAMLTQVQRWKQSTLENMDEIKKLPENQVAGYIYNSAEQFATGDSLTDSLMFQEVIKSTAELVPVVATERYKWEQETALVNTVGLWDNTATTFEQVAARTAKLEDPSLQDAEWLNNFQNGLLSNLAKPAGMAEETYRSGMQQFYRSQIVSGNFHTVGVIRNSGFLEALPLEDRNRLETFYETQSTKRLMTAAEPYIDDFLRLEYDTVRGDVSLDEMASRMSDINAVIRRETGIDKPFFDVNDMRAAGRTLSNRIVAMGDEARRRLWQQEENDRNRQATADIKAQEEELDAAQARSLLLTGQIGTAKVNGVSDDLLNRGQYALVFNEGNYAVIEKGMGDHGWISPLVKDKLATRLNSSLGGWSDSMEAAYREFKTIKSSGPAGPAAVAAIYGDNLLNLERFDRLMEAGNVTPERAYQETFGAPTIRMSPLVPGRVAELNGAIDKILSNLSGNPVTRTFTGQPELTPSAKANIRAVISPRASASMAAMADVGGEYAATQEMGRALASGELEIAGSFAWRAPAGASGFTKSFADMVGTSTPQETGRALNGLVVEALQASGVNVRAGGLGPSFVYKDLTDIDPVTFRLPDVNGNARLAFSVIKDDKEVTVVVTSADVAARVHRREEDNAANRAYVQWLATPDGRSMARGSGSTAEQRARFTSQFNAGHPNPSGLPDGMRRRNPINARRSSVNAAPTLGQVLGRPQRSEYRGN